MTYNQELRKKIDMTIPKHLWLDFFEINKNHIFAQREFLEAAFMMYAVDKKNTYLDDNPETKDALNIPDFAFDLIDERIKSWKAHDKKAYDKEELCLERFDEELYIRWNEHLDQFMYTEEEFNKTVYDKWVPYVDEIIGLYKDATKKIIALSYNAECCINLFDYDYFDVDMFIKNVNEIINEFNLEVTNILDEGENLLTISLY